GRDAGRDGGGDRRHPAPSRGPAPSAGVTHPRVTRRRTRKHRTARPEESYPSCALNRARSRDTGSQTTRRSSGVKCRNCGDEVDPRRVELGYDYCTRPECQERLVKRVELARVTVNKTADQYVRAEEVVPSGPRPKWGIDEEDDEAPTPERRVQEPPPARRLSTEKKLQRASQKLDVALMQVYERFCRSEITC